MTGSESELGFSSEGSQETARLKNQSSLNLRELRKERG